MLVLTPKPHPTECISGYLHQLSKANHYDKPSWVIEPYRNGCHADDYRRITPEVMQEIANLTPEEARRVCVRPDRTGDRTTLRLLGTELHSSHVDMRSFRICPCCVAEHDRHEAFWHLRLVEWCPIHQVRLLNRCRACSHTLRWNRPKLGRCNCGSDLTVQGSMERCDSCLSSLLFVFRRALYGNDTENAVPSEMSHLLHMDLYRLIRMVEVLGEALYWQCRHTEKRTTHVANFQKHAVKIDLLEVAKILTPWPTSFQEALYTHFDKQLSEADARKSFRFAFPWAHFALGKNLKEHAGQLAFLREELARFGAAYWTRDQVRRDAEPGGLGQEGFRWGSVPDAAGILGMDPRTLLKRIREGTVPVRESAIFKRNRNYQVDLNWAKNQLSSANPEIKA